MTGQFGFSFDRETYRGAFESRQSALAAATEDLKKRADLPEGIFVGQWCEPDVQSDHHAEHVVHAMRDRWRQSAGEEKFIEKPSEQQLADLDYELSHVIRQWLSKHNMLPRPTKVRAVSEHAIPLVRHVAEAAGARETSVIGEV